MTRSEQLATYLAVAWGRAYLIGHWDCIIFVAMWADHMEGGHSCPPAVSHTTRLRDTYTSEQTGRHLYAPSTISAAIRWTLQQAGWQHVPRGSFEPGDIVLTNLDHPGIWDGEKIVAQPARASGLLHVHPRHAVSALRWPS